MKRWMVISVAVLALAIGTVVAVSAQTPNDSQGSGCGGVGPGRNAGSYDYKADPTFKAVADNLGVTVEELEAELQAGKSVADVAASKGVELNELVEIVDAPRRAMMNVMAEYGYASQDQIDAMNARMADWQKQALERESFFAPMGPGMMRSGIMGGMMGPGGMMDGQRGVGGMMRGFSAS